MSRGHLRDRELQKGDVSIYALAVGCLLVMMVLFLGLGDFLGLMGVREQAQTALVTSTRAAARQIDVTAWVLQHQLRLDAARAAQAFDATLAANMAQSEWVDPQRSIQHQFQTGNGPAGQPLVVGEMWVPVRTGNLGVPLTFHLKYRTFVTATSY